MPPQYIHEEEFLILAVGGLLWNITHKDALVIVLLSWWDGPESVNFGDLVVFVSDRPVQIRTEHVLTLNLNSRQATAHWVADFAALVLYPKPLKEPTNGTPRL